MKSRRVLYTTLAAFLQVWKLFQNKSFQNNEKAWNWDVKLINTIWGHCSNYWMCLKFAHIYYENFLVKWDSFSWEIRNHCMKHYYQLLHHSSGHPLHFMFCPLWSSAVVSACFPSSQANYLFATINSRFNIEYLLETSRSQVHLNTLTRC